MDESALASNVVGHPFWEAPHELRFEQLAPYGFLVVERLIAGVLGSSPLVLRLFPQVAGLAATFLFARIRPTLGRRAGVVAVGLFAFSDSLIYFSSEIKPYMLDVLAAVICLSLPNARELHDAGSGRLLATSAIGAALVWFSFPSAFCLAGVGLGWVLFGSRDARSIGRIALVTIPWFLSFLGSHAVARVLLTTHSSMWVFWGFAFPPRESGELIAWVGRRLLNLFANPMHFDTPFGASLSAVLGAAFALGGVAAVGRTDRERLVRLVGPILFALLAAWLRWLPFHGRLLLFTVPSLTWLIAEGAAALGDRLGGGRRADGLVVALLLTPFLVASLGLIEPPPRHHAPQGDLRENPWR